MTLSSAGVIPARATANPGFSMGGVVALAVLRTALIGFWRYATILGVRAEGTRHPSYETERGEQSSPFSHVADQAYQDLTRNRAELRLVYELLKRAAVASGRAVGAADDAAASAAITDVVGSETPRIGRAPTTPTQSTISSTNRRPTSSSPTPSYAEIVKKRGRWALGKIDVSLDRGRESQYRAGVQVCPQSAARGRTHDGNDSRQAPRRPQPQAAC